MVRSRADAARRAEQSNYNTPGTCQLWTRTMFDAPSAGDRDGDGDADAVDGWKSEPEKYRHTDRKPPRGTPIAWSGGSKGYGHRAVSLGPDKSGVYQVRSTDAPVRGRVGTVPLDWFERNWGLKYLGWSESITGTLIPGAEPEKPSRGVAVDSAIDKLKVADERAKAGSPRDKLIKQAVKILRKIRSK